MFVCVSTYRLEEVCSGEQLGRVVHIHINAMWTSNNCDYLSSTHQETHEEKFRGVSGWNPHYSP
jgi:hypothetical protein